MMEDEQLNQPSYYAVIPASVLWDKDLPAFVRLLYGVISSLCNEQGYCWATNRYFAERFNVTTVCVSNWISQLVKKGHIRTDEVPRKDGSLQRRIFIADGSITNQRIDRGKSYNVGGLNDGLENENISLRGVNDTNEHNTKSNKQTNKQFNNKKSAHVFINGMGYLVREFNIAPGLVREWVDVDWNRVHPDCVENILEFIRYRTTVKKKPINSSKGMNALLNPIRGKSANEVERLIVKAMDNEWMKFCFDNDNVVEKTDKWKSAFNKIK